MNLFLMSRKCIIPSSTVWNVVWMLQCIRNERAFVYPDCGSQYSWQQLAFDVVQEDRSGLRYWTGCIFLVEFRWHELHSTVPLCLSLFFIEAEPDEPWHESQNDESDKLNSGFVSVMSWILPVWVTICTIRISWWIVDRMVRNGHIVIIYEREYGRDIIVASGTVIIVPWMDIRSSVSFHSGLCCCFHRWLHHIRFLHVRIKVNTKHHFTCIVAIVTGVYRCLFYTCSVPVVLGYVEYCVWRSKVQVLVLARNMALFAPVWCLVVGRNGRLMALCRFRGMPSISFLFR